MLPISLVAVEVGAAAVFLHEARHLQVDALVGVKAFRSWRTCGRRVVFASGWPRVITWVSSEPQKGHSRASKPRLAAVVTYMVAVLPVGAHTSAGVTIAPDTRVVSCSPPAAARDGARPSFSDGDEAKSRRSRNAPRATACASTGSTAGKAPARAASRPAGRRFAPRCSLHARGGPPQPDRLGWRQEAVPHIEDSARCALVAVVHRLVLEGIVEHPGVACRAIRAAPRRRGSRSRAAPPAAGAR